ncbi:SapC family protein [Halovibrio sp. HP20-50]|uniref:SapC family protein n=1 Tax=Halovibrio sp. HP20-59 TaxID=3080275 RepID=UPI00294AC898|nr:SapC family protein [Halovibrio sp. HP20-59]MEA2120073.1 SapC family protein [Halovibrio sp. HP20-59]
MTEWTALSPSQHRGKHHLPRDGYTFAQGQSVVGVFLAELPKLLPLYMLGFIQQGEQYTPVALLGLGQHNLYVAPNGKWLGGYVPATLRGYPFTLANSETGEKVFAIDADHLSDDAGEPLFDEADKLTGKAAETFTFMQQCEQNRQATQQAVKALGDAGVIEPWPLKIERGEGHEPLTVNGLFRVNEKALNSLAPEVYATLKGGPMALAHAQLFSVSQMNQLSGWAKFHAQQGTTEAPENLDSVFDNDNDLEFDFDS